MDDKDGEEIALKDGVRTALNIPVSGREEDVDEMWESSGLKDDLRRRVLEDIANGSDIDSDLLSELEELDYGY